MMLVTGKKLIKSSRILRGNINANSLADTLDSLDVKGAAHEASPSLILGTSLSSSASASASVIAAKLN